MNTPKLELRSIDALVEHAFVIPSYQRGYRWSAVEVRALLDDLHDFQNAKKLEFEAFQRGLTNDKRSSLGRFYCLQPIVVVRNRPRENEGRVWTLIDGQQRLTTIHLIIRYLKGSGAPVRGNYTVRYETRKLPFLEDLDPGLRWRDPDSYYMHAAYQEIERWFSEKGPYASRDVADILLRPDGPSANTKVIWYEIPEGLSDSSAETDAFIRLNAGKIRLTNAELIRALFLKAGNFDRHLRDLSQIKMAQEWDRIEQRLQQDRFWYFLHGEPSPYDTRIDHLFRVHLKTLPEDPLEGIPESTEFLTFLAYQALEKKRAAEKLNAPISDQWDGVRNVAMRLEEWHEDRVLYHLIGFWVALRSAEEADNATVLVNLLTRRETMKHREFEESVKADIFHRLIGKDEPASLDPDDLRDCVATRLRSLHYESTRGVREVLLLFNIATLLQNATSSVRFPFDRFSQEEWDIEHIRPVESRMPKKVPDQRAWLEVVVEYWTGVPAPQLVAGPGDALADQTRKIEAILKQPRQPPGARHEALRAVLGLPPDHTVDSTATAPAQHTARADHEDAIAALLGRAWLLLAEELFTREVQDAFEALYRDVLGLFGEQEELNANHALGNLTLLDASTNRRFRNAPFPVKRKHVLAHDRSGTFVPRCTTNAFLKYYSRRLQHLMTWTEECAEDHLEAMVGTLTAFFAEGGHRPEGVERA